MPPTHAPLPSPLEPEVESRPGLLRALGPGMSVAIVVGGVIGSGIFAKPGRIAEACGDFRLIFLAWVGGGILSLLGALCFAELGAMLPRAGGIYVYLREGYGRLTAFLFGFNEFVFGRPASIGALSTMVVTILLGWFSPARAAAPGAGPAVDIGQVVLTVLLSIVLIVAMMWINILGVIWGGRLQGATTLIKAGFLGLMGLLPFVLWCGGAPHSVDWSNYATQVEPKFATLSEQLAAVLLAVMWAYNGWHDVAPVAEEIRDPQRNIPFALVVGVAIVVALYLTANLAYHAVLPMAEIRAADQTVAQAMIARLLTPFGTHVAAGGAALMSAVIMCSSFGAINANFLLGPRVGFAMGRDDTFVRQLGAVHVNYRSPAVAILVQGIMATALVVVSGILVVYVPVFREKSIFTFLTDYVVFSASIFYMLCVLGVPWLRYRRPDWDRPYRTWGYPVTPLLFLVVYVWFLAQVLLSQPYDALIGVGLIALGVPVYFAWQTWAAVHPQRVDHGTVP